MFSILIGASEDNSVKLIRVNGLRVDHHKSSTQSEYYFQVLWKFGSNNVSIARSRKVSVTALYDVIACAALLSAGNDSCALPVITWRQQRLREPSTNVRHVLSWTKIEILHIKIGLQTSSINYFTKQSSRVVMSRKWAKLYFIKTEF